ncbi:GNAT family N-acetyltransferase [Aeromicrobium chenweiae]|uniref:GNAT family N-acetyltransferase n=1 Tax=Aeromicrobium chenweiae TaxID=2079793 RepID=A0A2S0WHY4_9ACTN|nr:GNAT family N-acetyltransferase [Aeromicrobium chenweiae]AWB90902.1 GNAT family N-acetyltransferase [Aeromicrobium chenweiae]TGN32120.1 GNAT family N-acetyltransferase [Aeromicrobium chenweiae]
MTYAVDEISMPESLEAAGAEQFLEYAAVRNAVETHTLGTGLLSMAPPEILAEYRDNPHRVRRHFVVRDDGRIVGRGMVTLRPHVPDNGAYLMVDVLPSHRGRGIGAAILRTVEQAAVESAAHVLKVAVPHSAAPGGERLASPTGFGDVSAADAGVRFLTSHGYALEQITRISTLDTAAAAVPRVSAGPGADHRVITWVGPTPAGWVGHLAVLRTRMSTDAPSAGLVAVADPWDAARIREHDERIAGSGRTMLTAAVEHVPSGALVGFSELICSDAGTVAIQEDTLVLRERRGRRLGTALKLATTDLLLRHAPEVEAVVTWNAEENRPMLDVNEAMGFRAIGYEGGWQKRV